MTDKPTNHTTSSVGVTPFNDHLLIELPKAEWATADEQGEQDDPRSGSGVVVAVPEVAFWLSSYTWIAERSVANPEVMATFGSLMNELMGKRVYFEKRADIGNTIEVGDKKYATIKLSKITAVES